MIFLVVALMASTRAGQIARRRGTSTRQRAGAVFQPLLRCDGHRRPEWLLQWVNPAAERTLGYSRQELLSRRLVDFIHPEDRNPALRVLDGLSTGDGPVHFEVRCICRDGSVRWLDGNLVSGQGVVYGAARDITERRREQSELAVLAEQQAALRRVATLVARGVGPSEVFSAVAEELARVLGVQNAAVWRYEPDGAATLLAARDDPGAKKMPVGKRFTLEGDNVAAMVFRTGRPARMDSHDHAAGSAAAQMRELGLRGGVGAPIIVDGRLWGAAIVGSSRPAPLPPDTEERIADFTDLVATAIANAQTHAELTASRARIVAAAMTPGAVSNAICMTAPNRGWSRSGLRCAPRRRRCPPNSTCSGADFRHRYYSGRRFAGSTRDLTRRPSGDLVQGRIGARAQEALGRRSAVPVELDLAVDRWLPESVEVGAVVAEALTNAAKHAQASEVTVGVEAEDAYLRLSIRDDGIGGADTANGSGLIGLVDRVEARGCTMAILSHTGTGTSLHVKIPLEVQ
jgi:PAS domain S-box-containing protein